jgi:TolB-like protein
MFLWRGISEATFYIDFFRTGKKYCPSYFGLEESVMVKKVKWSVSLLLLYICLTYSQQPENQIAVLNLDPIGASVSESNTLTDRLRSELVNTNYFTVIERKEMDEILTEQGFQQSGCTSDPCAVEIGRLLNIRRICAGSIGKVGSTFTITLRMIDVETGVILFTVTEDCACPIEQVLTRSMKNLAVKLADMSRNKVGAELLEEQGDIYLKSEPTSARVYVDDEYQGVTPYTIQGMKDTKVRINLKKVYFNDWEREVVFSATDQEITANLAAKSAKLNIDSDPSGAQLILKMYHKLITGTTPYQGILQCGEYEMILKHPLCNDLSEKIVLEEKGTSQTFKLTYKTGLLKGSGQPKGSTILLNGVVVDIPEEGRELPIANYDLMVKHSGYMNKKATIQIQVDKITTFNSSLDPKNTTGAVWRSTVFPGLGQFYQEKKVRGIVFPVLIIGASAGAYYYGVYSYNESVDNYKDIREQYETAFSESEILSLKTEMHKAYDEIQNNKEMGRYFLAAAGTLWVFNILDVLFLPPRYEAPLSFSFNKNQTFSADLKISW